MANYNIQVVEQHDGSGAFCLIGPRSTQCYKHDLPMLYKFQVEKHFRSSRTDSGARKNDRQLFQGFSLLLLEAGASDGYSWHKKQKFV
jgi:hypothetical protein